MLLGTIPFDKFITNTRYQTHNFLCPSFSNAGKEMT